MQEKPLLERVSLVTGAGSGIGRAIALALAHMGSTVLVCGRRQRQLADVVSEIGGMNNRAEALVCDVTSLESVRAAESVLRGRHRKLDILVNNAGLMRSGPLVEMDPAAWDETMNTNLRGVFYCVREFFPLMPAGSHIVNISSLAGKNPVPNNAAYAASKWGLNGLSYSLAEELRGKDIRVSVVCPGSVDTDLSPHDGKLKSKMLKPEDVAHAVVALVTQSPQSFISEVLIRPKEKP